VRIVLQLVVATAAAALVAALPAAAGSELFAPAEGDGFHQGEKMQAARSQPAI
jgi:hypothetical protein